MKKLFVSLSFLLAIGILWIVAVTLTGGQDKLLTSSDVEKVSGLKNIALIPKDASIGAGGDLNFGVEGKQVALMVQVVDKSQYAGYKHYFFKAAVDGIGEEAMQGATLPEKPDNIVVFVKGSACIALTTLVNPADIKTNMLTADQMVALAEIIASRL